MITKRALLAVSLLSLLSTAEVMGGSGGGGSGPPAKEQLLESLMSQSTENAGLFAAENGGLNLGVNGSLDSDLLLSTKGENGLKISASDFDRVSSMSLRAINAIDLRNSVEETKTRSYLIADGDQLGELVLKDRREVVRSAIR